MGNRRNERAELRGQEGSGYGEGEGGDGEGGNQGEGGAGEGVRTEALT